MKLKWILYGAVGLFVLFNLIFGSDDSSSSDSYETATVYEPTLGVHTILQQQRDSAFLIEDEVEVPSPEDSRIIAKYLDASVDTFTLDEVQLMATNSSSGSSSHRAIYRGAYYGLMGYMMGRSMSTPVSRNAYMDQSTYNKVSNGPANRMRQTASSRTVSRPSSGKSGYGSGGSTRSYGG
ncbi:MAG: hypothetical protein AAF242_02190 [Bacteroidota bacterium]